MFTLNQQVFQSEALPLNQKLETITAIYKICRADKANFFNNIQKMTAPLLQTAESFLIQNDQE